MSGSRLARKPWALIGFLAVAAGCQSYNFNPVGSCMLQSGRTEYTLSDISTADVVFVVDDSGSMAAEQQRLAANFSAFINNLDKANAAMVAGGLAPFDFHISVTTSSVFHNVIQLQTCKKSENCSGSGTSLVCCLNSTNAPAKRPRACTPGVTQCPSGTSCGTNCPTLKGENYCCDQASGSFPAGTQYVDTIPCSLEGSTCGSLDRHFNFTTGCIPGVAQDEYPYARGDYVAAAGNPRILHFDKSLYPKPEAIDPARTCSLDGECGAGERCRGTPKVCTKTLNRSCMTGADCATSGETCIAATSAAGAPTFCRATCGACASGFTCVSGACQPTNSVAHGSNTSQQLVDFFAGNVVVGTCGSPQEQGLSAARTAIEKAVAGQQPEGLHQKSKLVLVFVGDEDDCSSPEDPSGGVVMDFRGTGDDACVHDTAKRYDVASRFVNYFLGVKGNRPDEITAAFVQAAHENQCGYGSLPACTTEYALCCQQDCPTNGTCGQSLTEPYCGGQAFGKRFFAAADLFKASGVNVLTGSICDIDFRTLLDEIGKLAVPPSGLALPSLPASGDITVLRILDANESTRKICKGPLQPGAYTLDQAMAATDPTDGRKYDWWFTPGASPSPPSPVSMNVYINPSGACKLNPGETYSAEYIGRLPEDGCQTEADCQAEFGGSDEAWTCYAGMQGDTCTPPTPSAPGTCICGSRSTNCPNG